MICTPLSWNVISVLQSKKITTEPCKIVVSQFFQLWSKVFGKEIRNKNLRIEKLEFYW